MTLAQMRNATVPLAPGPPSAWLTLAACAVMVGMAFGAIVNIAVFLTPLAVEFDWPRGELALAYALAGIGTGIGGIFMGHFADRVPIRRLALCGAIVPSLAFLMLSRVTSMAELYTYHLLMGLVGTGALLAPLNRLAALCMPLRPGVAVGIVSAGGAMGQAILPLLAGELVVAEGWRGAYVTLGLLHLGVVLPLALWLRDPPAVAASTGAGASRNPYAVSRTSLLAWLCVAVVFCCVCMATPIVHVAALGVDLGLGRRASTGLLTTIMLFGMAGRVAFGRLADQFGNLRAYMVASAGQTATAMLFPLTSTALEAYVVAALFGLAFSGAMTSFILCAREYADPAHGGFAIGLVSFFGWAGMGLGAWQGGLFFDLCGSYGPSFTNASLGGVANLLVLGLLYLMTLQRAPAQTATT